MSQPRVSLLRNTQAVPYTASPPGRTLQGFPTGGPLQRIPSRLLFPGVPCTVSNSGVPSLCSRQCGPSRSPPWGSPLRGPLKGYHLWCFFQGFSKGSLPLGSLQGVPSRTSPSRGPLKGVHSRVFRRGVPSRRSPLGGLFQWVPPRGSPPGRPLHCILSGACLPGGLIQGIRQFFPSRGQFAVTHEVWAGVSLCSGPSGGHTVGPNVGSTAAVRVRCPK